MKYNLEGDLSNSNTSHAQVVEMVGTAKRVLDIGCSTGYLARILSDRGNRVSGVEIDEQAAKRADEVLEKVVVGDVESIDLLEHYEAGSFDVIVFADVLEHLRDPVRVLTSTLPLLHQGGSVIVSVPNVAHGSVRLALLEGRFEYRPHGLLDDTHLRFFTRRSVEQMLASAGLTTVEMRRTTADALETEIPLDRSHFSDELVDRVRSTADGDTYQFIFRAMADSTTLASPIAGELLARNEQLAAMQSYIAEIRAAGDSFTPPHRVGLLVDSNRGSAGPWESLRNAVTTLELRRRIDHISLVHLRSVDDGAPATWRGEPVEVIDVDSAATPEVLADAYDALLLVGDRAVASAGTLLDELGDHGCPIIPVGVARSGLAGWDEFDAATGFLRGSGPPGSTSLNRLSMVPDPLVLADRLIGADSLPLRRAYLQQTGRLRVLQDYLLFAAGPGEDARLLSLAKAVDKLATRYGCEVVVVPAPGSGSLTPLMAGLSRAVAIDAPTEIDLLALAEGARLVVTNSAAAAALAFALRRTLLGLGGDDELEELASWSGDPDLLVPTPAALLAAADLASDRSPDDQLRGRMRAPIEMAYDDLAGHVIGVTGRRVSLSIGDVLRLQQTRIATLEAANAALQVRLVTERNALGTRAVAIQQSLKPQPRREIYVPVPAPAPPTPAPPAQESSEDAARLAELQRQTESLERELNDLMATKTMRLLGPARRLYGRIRRLPR